MSGPADPDSRLPHLLAEEVARLRDFLVLLQEEQDALVAGDADRLLPLATRKSELYSRLSNLGAARVEALAAQALPGDRRGTEAWLLRHPSAAAQRTWQELLALAARARALNDSNGKLIATRLGNNQQALSALMAAANQAALYGPDGQARAPGSGRSFGSV